MSPLLFHCADYCPYAQRVWIALELTGTPYEYVETNVWGLRLPVTKAFRRRSRSRTLPTLFREGMEYGLDDSLPVINFLDRLSGGKLMPQDPDEAYNALRVSANEVSNFVSGFYSVLRGKSDYAATEEGRIAKLEGCMHALDAAVGSGLASAVQPLTLADVALFPFIERSFGVGLLETYRSITMGAGDYPLLWAWYERMTEEPAVKATLWQYRTGASLATQPYAGDATQTRAAYLTSFYRKYASDTVAEENAGLVVVRPPAFDAAEWERLGAEDSGGDTYEAVPPGGSAEAAAKKPRR